MKQITNSWYYASKLHKWLQIGVSDQGVQSLQLLSAPVSTLHDESNNIIDELNTQLDEYFKGTLRKFDIPLDLIEVSAFYKKVWSALLKIPYGETRSYSQMAEEIGHVRAARAIGTANSRNPVPIIIPCHRVIKHDGSLGGYSSGTDLKRLLLEHEGARFILG